MIIEILKIIFRFIVLIAVQVLVLNHVEISGYINPFLYVLFILMLPVRIPRLLLLITAFATGLCVDLFTNTAGMHAAACVMMAFLRPGWLKIIAPRDGYDVEAVPSVKRFGFQWFIIYSSVMVLVHHVALFYIEVFRFSEFFTTLTRALLSTAVTLLLIIITQYLFTKAEER